MEIGIIGLPKTGKTTIFNALTKGLAETKLYSGPGITTNLGIAKVPDQRLSSLATMLKTKKAIPAEVKYIDIAGISKGFGKEQGVSGELLNYLSTVDAILQVVRMFDNDNIPHIESSIDPLRDIETLDMELIFSDLIVIERRLSRLEVSLKMTKSQEREAALHEQDLLKRIKESLDRGTPIRLQLLPAEEMRLLANYQFLTAKPMLIVINLSEKQIPQTDDILDKLKKAYTRPQVEFISMCGKLEMELIQLSEQEADEFRRDIGLKETAFSAVIKHSYNLLDLISFFTHNVDEVRAWAIHNNTTAVKAAGKIHTDMEKGFIRAEVINYDDFTRYGNIAEARKHGVLRLEGKNYPVKDGDIIHFLFNL